MRTARRQSEPLSSWVARQRRRHVLMALAAVVAVGGLLIYRSGFPWGPAPVGPRVVGRVVQWLGDSPSLVIAVESDHAEFTLLGVAAPLGPGAVESLVRLAPPDTRLILSFDPDLGRRPDAAGRPLVYAYLPDGRMLNELLLAEAHAGADPDPPHELSRWFNQIEGRARRRESARRGSDDSPLNSPPAPAAAAVDADPAGRGATER